MVVQTAQHGTLADGTARDSQFTRLRNSLLKPLKRSLTIVEGDILLQNPRDLTPASKYEIVRRLSSHGPEEPLQDTVHVRRLHARLDRYQIVRQEVDIEHQSIVMDEIDFAGYGFAEWN